MRRSAASSALLVAALALPATARAQEGPPAAGPQATPSPAKEATVDAPPVVPLGPDAPLPAVRPATTPPPSAPPPAAPSLIAPLLKGFSFGSYGRVIAATDLKGRPGRDANIVAHGSRLDEGNYVELELRRDDYWKKTDSSTRVVATLAIADPLFHYTGSFGANLAVRNLYLEEQNLGARGLSVWAGSRMYRGDDIYLLDWWPLDNLNTLGGGARYEASKETSVALHVGVQQPAIDLYQQSVERPLPYNQVGSAQVLVLNRQQLIGSAKVTQLIPLGNEGAGLKLVAYAEAHQLPSGQEQVQPGLYHDLPEDDGFVVGGQLGAYSGSRDTHVNLFVRYARGIAAYGDFAAPTQLSPDRTTDGAHELVVALGGNFEYGPVGLMLGAYVRSFRNASPALDFDDLDEGIVVARPHVFFGELGGLALEGSYQAQQRGVVAQDPTTSGLPIAPTGPLTGRVGRFGVIPFLSPAGRGDYSRPQFRLIYVATFRNQGAMSLYPSDDVFSLRSVEHFLGLGAEWWFNSSSYGG